MGGYFGIAITVLYPKKSFDVNRLKVAIDTSLESFADFIEADFKRTYSTWSRKPKFERTKPGPIFNSYGIRVFTKDNVYTMLNYGTKPHAIIAKKKALRFQWAGRGSYRAKSKVRTIGSYAGGPTGQMNMMKRVKHPGTEARRWDIAIIDKYTQKATVVNDLFNRQLERALR